MTFMKSVLQVGKALSRHPVVGLLETAGIIGGAAKLALDTGLPQKGLEQGKALAVSGYAATRSVLGSMFAPPSGAVPVAEVEGRISLNNRAAILANAQKAARLRAQKYQQQLNQYSQYGQQQQYAQQAFNPAQMGYQPFPGQYAQQGFYDPSQYPQGFDPTQMGFNPGQMDPSMMGFDPNQGIDPTMFVQGVFSVDGLPLYRAREPVEVAGHAHEGGCTVGCAGKAGDPAHKPCGPCAAKAAQAGVDVEGAAELVVSGDVEPTWAPPGGVGKWIPGHWESHNGVRHWVTSHDDGASAAPATTHSRLWRWKQELADELARRARARAERQRVAVELTTRRPSEWYQRTPRAAAASSVFDAARISNEARVASLRAQLANARNDANLAAAIQQRIDMLAAQNATAAAAQAALVSSTQPWAAELQQQVVTLAQTAPDQVPAMLAHLSAQVGHLARGQGVANQAAQMAAQSAQQAAQAGERAAEEVESHEWTAPPGTPADTNVTPFDINPDVDQGEGSNFQGNAAWDELDGDESSDVDGVRGVGYAFEDVSAAIDLAGRADDMAALASYGMTWDVPTPDAVASDCKTCPPGF